jgi:hypothetical protein
MLMLDSQATILQNPLLPAVVGSQTKYRTIVADPPWKYGKWGKASVPNYDNSQIAAYWLIIFL